MTTNPVDRKAVLALVVRGNDTIRRVAMTLRRQGARFDLDQRTEREKFASSVAGDRTRRGKRDLTGDEWASVADDLARAQVAYAEAELLARRYAERVP